MLWPHAQTRRAIASLRSTMWRVRPVGAAGQAHDALDPPGDRVPDGRAGAGGLVEDLVVVRGVDRSGVAAELELVALVQHDARLSEAEIGEGKQQSVWVIMARRNSLLSALKQDGRWRLLLDPYGGQVWTDNYSNIVQALRWR